MPKLIKDNADIFAGFAFTSLNKSIEHSVFPSKLRQANLTPVHKKSQKAQKTITDLSVFYQISLTYSLLEAGAKAEFK